MITDWHFYALAIPAVILLGLAKGGFAGMGALSLPLLAFAIDPVRAAAITLPVLILQDIVGVWAFRRTVDGDCSAGCCLARSSVSRSVTDSLPAFRPAQLWPRLAQSLRSSARIASGPRHQGSRGTADWPEWIGSLFGVASGFTSQVAHAGQPPSQLWCSLAIYRAICWAAPPRFSSQRSTGSRCPPTLRWASSRAQTCSSQQRCCPWHWSRRLLA